MEVAEAKGMLPMIQMVFWATAIVSGSGMQITINSIRAQKISAVKTKLYSVLLVVI